MDDIIPPDAGSPPGEEREAALVASEPTQPKVPAPDVDDAEEDELEETPAGRFRGVNVVFTIVVGLLMFLAGGLTGYFGRPYISPTPTPPPDQRQQLLAMVISKTRHWKGNTKAPVVMIEFSDYQ